MATKQSSLGRGIDSLLASDFDPKVLLDSKEQVNSVKLTDIEPNKSQPRKIFDDTALSELSQSIKQHGILQPLVIAPKQNGKYEIIAGERRWRASKLAGLNTVPALIRTIKESQKLELALIENVQRVDLSPIEQAVSVVKLHEEFNLSYSEIAKRLGKAETTLSNIVRLLQLPADGREALQNKEISEGHARAILALKGQSELQKQLLKHIKEQGWSVRQAEQFAVAHKQGIAGRQALTKRVANQTKETKKLSDKLGFKVTIQHMAKGGRLQVHFTSDNDLDKLYRKLGL